MQYYRHLKSGKLYRLVGMGKWEGDESYVAIYKPAGAGENVLPWVRPLSEFEEKYKQLTMLEFVDIVRSQGLSI